MLQMLVGQWALEFNIDTDHGIPNHSPSMEQEVLDIHWPGPLREMMGNDGQPVVFQTSMFGGIGEACIFNLCLNQHGKFNHSRVLSEQDSEGILINHESHLYIYFHLFLSYYCG